MCFAQGVTNRIVNSYRNLICTEQHKKLTPMTVIYETQKITLAHSEYSKIFM